MSLFNELKRRNVFRVAAAYVITGWLLIQVLELAADSFGAPDWVMKMIITVVVIGFLPALLFSWAFELTTEGLRREREVVRDESIADHTGRKLDYITLAAAIGVAGLFALQQLTPPDAGFQQSSQELHLPTSAAADNFEPESDSHDKTIAVLPFVNMSADADNEYFSDGISEELLNVLVRVEGLQVASRTSAFSFKNKDADIPTVAAALRVKHIVEGSVRRAGDQVRITAQLIDATSDKHLWSGTYTKELKDVFAIQDEIAAAIADALKLTLLGSNSRQISNIEAYDLYLLGRHHFHQRTPASLPKAIELFEQVIEMDPEFAPAYSGLADAYSLVFQYGDYDPEQAIAKSLVNASKAVELDPLLAEAHASLGLNLAQRGQLAAARSSYLRAIELNPDYSMAHMWLGTSLSDKPGQALEVLRAAEQVDPLHPVIAENIGDMLRRMGRFDEGAEHLKRAIEASPETVVLYFTLSTLEFDRGDFAANYRAARQAVAVDPNSPYALTAMMYAETDLGNFESAETWLRRLATIAPNNDNVGAGWFSLHEAKGELDQLLQIAQAGYDRSSGVGRHFLGNGLAAARLMRNEFDEALAVLEQLPNSEIKAAVLGTSSLTALAHYQTGNIDRSRESAEEGLQALAAMAADGFDLPWMNEAEAILLALLDRDDEAIVQLQVGFDSGLRNIYGYTGIWVLDRLLGDDQRYQTIKQAMYADVRRQKVLIDSEKQACLDTSAVCVLADIDNVL